MAIIIEGPDAAGKTTLGRELRDRYGFKLIVAGGAPRNPDEVVAYCEEQISHLDDRNAVLDRVTPISHPIYNEVYRNSDFMSGYLKQMLNHPHTIILYCRPPTDILMTPEKHEWKDYDTEEHKQKILQRQHEFIAMYDKIMLTIPHIDYDYTLRDNAQNVIDMLVECRDNDNAIIKARSLSHAYGAFNV